MQTLEVQIKFVGQNGNNVYNNNTSVSQSVSKLFFIFEVTINKPVHIRFFILYLHHDVICWPMFFFNFRPRVPSGDILDSSTSHHIHHPESHNISHLQLTVTPAQERTPRVTNAPLSPLLVSSRRRRRTRTLQKPSSTMTSIRYVKVFNFWKCDSSFQKQFVFVLETAFLDDFGNLDQPNLSLLIH